MNIHRIVRDLSVLADQLEVPGTGFLPVNAFVLHASEPVVIDTGLSLPGRGFLDALGSVIDPADVGWIWLTPTATTPAGCSHCSTLRPRHR